jgi:hypothetical protein
LAGGRREGRISLAATINTAVERLSETNLGAGEVMEGGEREDWADVERFPG